MLRLSSLDSFSWSHKNHLAQIKNVIFRCQALKKSKGSRKIWLSYSFCSQNSSKKKSASPSCNKLKRNIYNRNSQNLIELLKGALSASNTLYTKAGEKTNSSQKQLYHIEESRKFISQRDERSKRSENYLATLCKHLRFCHSHLDVTS